ncbi:MAG: peptide-methionine (R)-S-oxide reductase MsrB [Bacteroidetes bacterium]|nr:peptide-methionine (R)-S-oxide reductase MsrB [Bacteroidota bacterium]
MRKHLMIFTIALIPAIFSCGQSKTSSLETKSDSDTTEQKIMITLESPDYMWDGVKITKTDAEWQKIMTEQQFYVARQAGTERPFKNPFHDNHEDGIYYCVGCGMPLFDAKHKFDSGTGWPSFYQPINAKNIATDTDTDIGYVRDEIHCARCEAHLGHVFDDAPSTPTGLRYCINSASLIFKKR